MGYVYTGMGIGFTPKTNRLNTIAIQYAGGCAESASIGAASGALGGPMPAARAAAGGCVQGVVKTALKNHTSIDEGTIDLVFLGLDVAGAGVNVIKYGRSFVRSLL